MRVRSLLLSTAAAAALVAGVGGNMVTTFAKTTTTTHVTHKASKASPTGGKHNTPKTCVWINKHHHSCTKG